MNTAMDIVKKARMVSRPTTLEFIDKIFTDFVELHGDRHFADDKAIVGGVAFLDETPVTVIGVQKGHSLQENMNRNFGTPHPEGYRKQLRLMKQAEKFGRPIILFVNTSGAYCGIGAEERGQGEAIARNLMEMAGIKVPIISIFIGEGGSGGALALALADVVWMLDNGMYAVLSPEGFSSILWRSPERVEDAAALMKLTAKDLLKNGVIDEVVPESENGIANELSVTTERLHQRLSEEVKRLLSMKDEELLEQRYERFRKFGEYTE